MTKFFKNLYRLILIGTPLFIIFNYIKNFLDNYKKFPHQWKNAYTVEENIKSIITVHNYRNRKKAKYFFE